jgi:hypothetical protein
MWKVDGLGEYKFSDGVDPNQATLFTPTPGADFSHALWAEFRGRAVYAEEIIRHGHGTAYLEKHTREALRVLEENPSMKAERIEVEPLKKDGSKRRRGTFPDGTLVRFVDKTEAP